MSVETSLICLDCKKHITVGKFISGLYRMDYCLDELDNFLKDHSYDIIDKKHNLIYWTDDSYYPIKLEDGK